jgi:serine/threonine protein kinase
MLSSPRVLREEVLYHSDRMCVRRRYLDSAPGSIIVKELLGADAATRLHREVRILERLRGVEGVSQLTAADSRCNAIMLEDVAGIRLSHILKAEPMSTHRQVVLMQQLAEIVTAVHQKGIIHKDINPFHIMLSGAERKPTLVNFEFANTSSETHGAFVHHRRIAGTLAYLAPELTGRTGRSIDHRADLYALGATFYEMSTGRVPFADADPLRLIHDILTRVPTPPVSCDQPAPQGLSDIIMRLLEKEPDQRYQSADGLAHDLSRLRDALQQGKSASFPLGEKDFAPRLLPPSRLMGREAEIHALKAAFDAAMEGGSRAVLICGAPGVGKTALLNELRSVVTARHGWLVTGKFDEHRPDLASDAVHQALRALGRLLLAEPDAELAVVRANMLRALGAKAGEVARLLPEIAVLLGLAPAAIGSRAPHR